MKKVLCIAIIFLSFTITGLAKKYINTPFLEKVQRVPAIENAPAPEKSGVYKDGLIEIQWEPTPRGFNFTVVNQSNEPFSIIWQECYINDSFNKYTVVHGGIKDIRNMPPSSVSSRSKLHDFLYPAAFARYVRGRYTELRQKTIYQKKFKEKEAADYVPQPFVVTLTLQAGDARYTYDFHFKTELAEK